MLITKVFVDKNTAKNPNNFVLLTAKKLYCIFLQTKHCSLTGMLLYDANYCIFSDIVLSTGPFFLT